jgi:tRNA G46 methylase TrmB
MPINIDELKVGDIIYFVRPIWYHYALYIGNNKVIHMDNRSLFKKYNSIVAIQDIYKVKGIPYIKKDYNRKRLVLKDTFKKAFDKLGEKGTYNLVTNNCEHYITEICFGKRFSLQSQAFYTIIICSIICVLSQSIKIK